MNPIRIDFSNPGWQSHLQYAYTRRFPITNTFTQEENCIVNHADPAWNFGFDNISLVTKEKFDANVTLSTECSFERYGAPLLMMAKELHPDENGILRFDDYLEVVLWESGINVWRLWYDGKDPAEGGMTWRLLAGIEFEVAAGKVCDLRVTVREKTMNIQVDGHRIELYVPDIPDAFYAGIDACEGINRFYSFSVSEANPD